MKRIFRVIGLLLVMGFVWINVDYWQDPPFWRRWWDTLTHLEPDYMNFSPTAKFRSMAIIELPVAGPTELTVTADALRAAEAYAERFDSFALIVVHRGKVQTEWYGQGWDRDRLTQSQSMMKTMTALMLGIAVDDGFIRSPQDAIGEYLEEWRDEPRGDITIEQLMEMSSGLQQYEFTLNPLQGNSSFRFLFSEERDPVVLDSVLEWPPGSRFDYNDINAQLGGMIVQRASGQQYADYLAAKLWDPLGGQAAEVWLDREGGMAMTACCLLASAMDWAKVGVLLKEGGRINGRQVVSRAWIENMIRPSENAGYYGWFTWLGREMDTIDKERFPWARQAEPLLADDLIIVHGYGGQQLWISREHDLIIVRMGPFAGMQPLSPEWDDSFIVNTVMRGLKP